MKLEQVFEKKVFRTKIKSDQVRWNEIGFGYFVSPFMALISNAIFAAYLNRYYVDVIGWTKLGVFSTILPMFSVVFVILGNIMIGRMIDSTRTSQGKARPYLLISIPILAIAMLLMFSVPFEGSAIVQIIGITVSYNLYYAVAYPCYYTAHNSMVSLSTRDTDKRGILATLSNASTVAAAGLGGSILVPFFLQSYMFVVGENGLDAAASYQHWRVLALALAVVTAIGVLLEYYFTRERITEESQGVEQKASASAVSMKQHAKACTSDKYWWMIILFVLIFQMGQAFKNGMMGFYVRWMFDDVMNSVSPEQTSGTMMSALGVIGGIPSVLGMVVAWPIAKKLGKKNSIVLGLFLGIAGGMVAFLNVHDFKTVCVGIFLKSLGIIPAQFVMLALVSDVLDHLEAKNGFRSDGFTMAIYSAIFGALGGLCNGILNGLLKFAGYVNTGIPADPVAKMPIENLATWTGEIAYRQMGGVEQVLAFLYLVVDIITFAISIILIWKLNVEKNLKEE